MTKITVPMTGNGSRPNRFQVPLMQVMMHDSVYWHFGDVTVVNERYGPGTTDRRIDIFTTINSGIWINPSKAGVDGYDRFGINFWGGVDRQLYPAQLGMESTWNEYFSFLSADPRTLGGRMPLEDARRFMANLLIMYSAIGAFDLRPF